MIRRILKRLVCRLRGHSVDPVIAYRAAIFNDPFSCQRCGKEGKVLRP